MRTRSLTPGQFAIFRIPSCKDKLLAGLMVFCIFLNGFVPRFSIDGENGAALSRILASQSTLLQFFSFSTLPIKIVHNLFMEGNASASSEKKDASRSQDKNTANSSSDYTLFSFDKKSGSRHSSCQRFMETDGRIAGRLPVFLPLPLSAPGSVVAGAGLWFVLVLLFFFLLPRSSLSDAYASITVSARNLSITQLVSTSWVFHLIIINLKRSPLWI